MTTVSPQKPKIFIIVLNWNGWEDTVECLRSLKKMQYSSYEILVVDNHSTDDSVAIIRKEFPDITIIEMAENMGYAAGNNAGIRYGMKQGGDYFWILNNDTAVDENALQPLVDKMQTEPSIGICGSMLIYYHKRDEIQAMGGGQLNKWLGITHTVGDHFWVKNASKLTNVDQKLDFICGASMMASQKFIETVGLLQEDYFLFYEETDWAVRGQKKGFDVAFARDSIVYHKHGAAVNAEISGNQKRSRLGDYYQIKNRLKFTHRFFPLCLPTVYLTVIFAMIKRIINGQFDSARMILKLMFTYNK